MTLIVRSHPTLDVFQTALTALRARISFIPILADGTKRPAVKWKRYQQERPQLADARRWFGGTSYGIAFVTGQISGGLELVDFDTREVYARWAACMREEGLAVLLERIERGYQEESPQGLHLFYRCSTVAGNQKLAGRFVPGPEKVKALIETRGDGGYGIAAPSSGQVHPSGIPYQLMQGGVATIPTITPQERHRLLAIARTLDEAPPPEAIVMPSSGKREQARRGRRPGDLYNERISWEELLAPYGWELVRYVGEEGLWRRPGKEEKGISATTNYQHSDLLYVFSTSTCFEPQRGYNKFSAYALLAHGGDFSAAAKALAEQGYVEEEDTNASVG